MLDALPPNFVAALALRQRPFEPSGAADDFEALQRALVKGAIEEIESRTLPEKTHAPPLFVAAFRGEGFPDAWFDLFLREAADRLKDEHAFEAIWNAEQNAYIRTLLDEVAVRVGNIERMLGAPLRTGSVPIEKFAAAIRNRPTELLIARYRTIPYIDRGGVLRDALEWARAPGTPFAQGRLYVAPGGFGKTRLAIELLLTLVAEQGWSGTFLSERNTRNLAPGALAETVAPREAEGSLVIVDYAESQIALLEAVADVAAEASGEMPIRVVALARSVEGWWQGMQTKPGIALVFDNDPFELIEQPFTTEERDAFFAAAVAGFRQSLAEVGLATPTVTTDITGHRYDRPLTVAMAAFLAARGVAADAGQSVFGRIFLEEQNIWKRRLQVATDNDPALELLHRAAAQITLVQGATRAGAEALIAADPRAAAHGRAAQDQCRSTLENIYGDMIGDAVFLRPIEPDLLGEHAAMAALSRMLTV